MSPCLRPCILAAVAGALCVLHAKPAAADVSSWLSAGGGYGINRNESTKDYANNGAASFAIGVGSDPLRRIVAGGLLRSTTYFGLGTDLGISLRLSTGGFARGQWGLALDAGPMWRTFGGGAYGRWPVSAMLTGGAPWGVQLAIGGELFRIAGDDAQARGVVALLEIDFLRLTVMRQGSTDHWWQNPSPAGGRVGGAKRPPPGAGLLW